MGGLEVKYTVSLQEMLDFRETKAAYLKQLRERFHESIIITLGMNIPGPHKTGSDIYRAFEIGKMNINDALCEHNYVVLREVSYIDKAGYIEYYVLKTKDAAHVKKIMTEIEDYHPLGRIFDIDVYYEGGMGISRSTLGLPERKCFICGKNAKECGRSRAHSVQILEDKVHEIIREAVIRL